MGFEKTLKLGDLFVSSREKGKDGLPLLSVTLNDGLVERHSLDRRTETSLASSQHLLVREGYIAYNMMRIWQGALGRAANDGLISPAYVVLKAKQGIDSRYAAYLFKTARMIYLFWAYSYGLTADRLRLYFNDFAKIPVNLPPLCEQRKIAKILSTWDEAIATTEELLANSEQQKKALMQQLLTGKKRLSGFEGKWGRLSFSKLANLGNAKFDPKKNEEIKECIELEHISQETSNLLGSTTTKESISTKNVFSRNNILFGKLRPYLRKYWLSDRSGVCSTEIWVFNANPKYSVPEYVFQLVQMDFFIDAASKSSGTHMPRADWNLVRDIIVHVPSKKEQKKIATVLTACSQQIVALQNKLDCLKNEKKALMQQLLTGKRRVKVGKTQAEAITA